MPSRKVVIIAAVIAAAPAAAEAQTPVEFEVASVRPNMVNDHIVSINVGPGGRFAARGYTLVLLMQRAFAVMDWNVIGGPSWIRSDRFDVIAKANVQGNLSEPQLRPMLANLLADRFKLKLHHSSKRTFGYALEVAKGGPKLKAAADDEDHQDTFRLTNAGMSGQGISMHNFARFFGGKLGFIVVDETGLTGLYDFKADWKVESDQSAAVPGAESREPLRDAAFDALRRQLGLTVVPKQVIVEMLAIDHVEKPSAAEN